MRAEIGHITPPFALNDQNDENATPLEDKVMGDPVLLVFDRNPPDSDPESSAELLRAFAGLVEGLEGGAVTLLVISQRSKEENAALAQAEDIPFHLLTDPDGAVFNDYGIELADAAAPPASLIIDPNGRVAEICEGIETAAQIDRLLTALIAMHTAKPRGRLAMHPPVLVIPNVLDGETCARLIETFDRPVPLWESDGKVSEGFNVEQGDFKVRNEAYGNVVQYIVRDAELMREFDTKVMRRVIPQMDKAFGYSPASREQYRIACYDAAEGGSLPPHRDNPTEETKHRRFTVSVNLNNSAFEGGELVFRESSDHVYDVDEGTAIVWSASLLHEVLPVTVGRRFILGAHLYG